MEPKLVWQKLHLKYRVPVSAPKAEALAKFLALPGHEALRNRAKTLRMRQRKTHGEGEGARDLVGDPEDALGTGEMTVGGRLVGIGPCCSWRVADLVSWATCHSWKSYLSERDR